MRVDLAYGDRQRSVLLPDDVQVEFFTPRDGAGPGDLETALADACARPVGSAPLANRLPASGEVLLLVSDFTRGGGTRHVLPALVAHVEALGVARDRIAVVVARGTHRRFTPEERAFFRTGPLRGVTLVEHDCDDAASVGALLLTRRGTPVRVNRRLKDAGLVLLVSSISFHYFAGFGGGRKLVLPGCADRASILANHRLSLVPGDPPALAPNCGPGRLDGNPVHEDMAEALAALPQTFAVNFFTATDGTLAFLNAGDAVESHAAACEAYAATHRVRVAEPVEVAVVSCGGHPYDVNLLQAHKALRHASSVVADGGAVLFYARCAEGVGSESFERGLTMDRETFRRTAFDDYRLNNQTAVSWLGIVDRARVAMVTELDADLLAAAGVDACDNPEAFIADALERTGASRVAVVPYGAATLPTLERRASGS